MEKRVYGVLGISSIMSNWNADFSGYPKTTSDGRIFGSDKAFKYPMKKMWVEQGKTVIYIKSFRFHNVVKGTGKNKKETGEVQLIPRTLKERYEQQFDIELTKNGDRTELLKNLFKAVDIKNFGAAFLEEGNNVSITGAVQIGQGFNKYEESSAEEQPILSPFRDGSKDNAKAQQSTLRIKKDNDDEDNEDNEAQQSTLGTKIVSDEAHYFYPFAINPKAYKQYIELGVTEGYTQEDYEEFKRTSLIAATSYSTNAKIGCENEFALFIETNEELYLPILTPYIEFSKGEEKNTIKIKLGDLINNLKDRVKSVEIYYNPYTTLLEDDIDCSKKFNIFTLDDITKNEG